MHSEGCRGEYSKLSTKNSSKERATDSIQLVLKSSIPEQGVPGKTVPEYLVREKVVPVKAVPESMAGRNGPGSGDCHDVGSLQKARTRARAGTGNVVKAVFSRIVVYIEKSILSKRLSWLNSITSDYFMPYRMPCEIYVLLHFLVVLCLRNDLLVFVLCRGF